MEEVLRQSERRERARAAELAAILDAVPKPVWIAHDPHCLHISGTRAADALLRVPHGAESSLSAPTATKPRHFKMVKDGRDLGADELPVQRAARGIPVQDFELSVVFDDDTTREMLAYAMPIVDEESQPRGAIAVLVDISQRKRAEEQSRAILASLPAHIALINHGGTIVAVNPTWEAFTVANGGSPERCNVGANYLDVCRTATGEEAVKVAERLRAILDGTSTSFTLEYPCHSGTRQRWFLLQAVPLRHEEGGAVVTHTDVTIRVEAEKALRAGEARLAAILSTAADGVITIDAPGTIQSVNPAAERMFGYAAAEMIGQNVKLLMPSPYRDEHDSYLARYMQTGEKHILGIGREVNGRRKDGSTFPVDLAVSQVGFLNLFTGILRDISRRKELEQEVVEIASLEQQRIGQDLHDSVSQEPTALSMLAGDVSETLQSDPSNAPPLVERVILRLRRSQQDLRTVMRGLCPVSVDAEGLMAALSDLATHTRNEGKARCFVDCPKPVPVENNLIATHLYLIAQEAVHNAIKHAQCQNIRIAVESNDDLLLSVHDDGIGIISTPPTEDHSGLGLRIMRNRAAIIRGTLTIEPAKPAGTLVTCALARKYHEPKP